MVPSPQPFARVRFSRPVGESPSALLALGANPPQHRPRAIMAKRPSPTPPAVRPPAKLPRPTRDYRLNDMEAAAAAATDLLAEEASDAQSALEAAWMRGAEAARRENRQANRRPPGESPTASWESTSWGNSPSRWWEAGSSSNTWWSSRNSGGTSSGSSWWNRGGETPGPQLTVRCEAIRSKQAHRF